MTPATSEPAGQRARGEPGWLARTVASEWTKLRSVRSTWWCAAVGAGAMLVFAGLMGYTKQSAIAEDPASAAGVSVTQLASHGIFYLVQFAVLALAALAGAGEYANRGIVVTLQTTPRRGRVLAARTLVAAAVAFALGTLASALGLATLGALIGGPTGAGVGESLSMAVRAGVCMALFAVTVVGIGTALRSVAGTITAGFALLLVGPLILQLSGVLWLDDLAAHLPGYAGLEFYSGGDAGLYTAAHDSAPVLLSSLAGWALAAQLVGYAELQGRDV
ncbi:ABC-2 type transport system permease protein [Haloactinospora alba]|uniref:ABC-2 type transport system permease protein n=1 Tax=Haloactinospora alba TaxID=405555 RepID=A0A543NN74_9ACTN|nr:ABC transporter permease [Haloactinospora alba]TQN33279.1 ABC-2 type transport system permease protein [Haloactinospora alba]